MQPSDSQDYHLCLAIMSSLLSLSVHFRHIKRMTAQLKLQMGLAADHMVLITKLAN